MVLLLFFGCFCEATIFSTLLYLTRARNITKVNHVEIPNLGISSYFDQYFWKYLSDEKDLALCKKINRIVNQK